MKKDITLVIMAAGMGSRFGGLKQIEPIGPHGEFLIDYSIYDAVQAGFHKVVFVIKKENEEIFKETIGNRISKYVEVAYAYQDIEDLPNGFTAPIGREKPWGTGHAVYAARHLVTEPFAVINADDFYGRDAYETIAHFLEVQASQNKYCIVGYHVQNTLSENGSVKRAVCTEENGHLLSLTESTIEKIDDQIKATPLDGKEPFYIEKDCLVCMNMLGFNPSLFSYIEQDFPRFLKDQKEHLMDCEYFIPNVICGAQKEGYAEVYVVKTDAKWQGITYKEDKDLVVSYIQEQIKQGIYPDSLWNTL